MAKHTSFGVGGKASVYIEPDNKNELLEILDICKQKKISYFILGNGTNVVFSDKGFNGVVLCLKRLNKIHKWQNFVTCECGVNVFYLNKFLKENSLEGFEFSYGIPGSVGGMIIQNAGAYGHEVCEFVESVKILKDNKILEAYDFWFEYRNSSFKQNKEIILEATFKLKKGDKNKIAELQNSYMQKRLVSQPYNMRSAGSVFKRQGEIIPAKLIDRLGLKGVKIGGVEVSSVHANFIVCSGEAKSADIKKLIKIIKKKVDKIYGVKLEEEIQFVGG